MALKVSLPECLFTPAVPVPSRKENQREQKFERGEGEEEDAEREKEKGENFVEKAAVQGSKDEKRENGMVKLCSRDVMMERVP